MQVEALLAQAASKGRALTCDDVTLADQPSAVHPNEVDLRGRVTPRYRLPLPLLSAAMDTVTEAAMALAMAQQGGVGVLHRNLAPEEQARQVAWVRGQVHLGGAIAQPVCFAAGDRLSALQAHCAARQLTFHSFPILDADRRLVGLVTRNELAFAGDANPLLGALMRPLADLVHALAPCTSEEAHAIMAAQRVKRLPVVDAEGHLAALYVWRDLCQHAAQRAGYALDEEGHFLVAAAVSPQPSDWARVELLAAVGCKILVIDSSHGACAQVRDLLARVRTAYPALQLIVGNIASYASAKYLLQGAALPDALKVGIGPVRRLSNDCRARSARRAR